jgi:hypothetical protein
MWMDIFAHEFGHMIGLPDEYDPLLADSNAAKDLVIRRGWVESGPAGGQTGEQVVRSIRTRRDVRPEVPD